MRAPAATRTEPVAALSAPHATTPGSNGHYPMLNGNGHVHAKWACQRHRPHRAEELLAQVDDMSDEEVDALLDALGQDKEPGR